MRPRRSTYLLLVAAISVAGVVLRAPVLHTGFIVDDYAQLSMMAGTYPVARAPLSLFTFSDGRTSENRALVDSGFFPWWTQRDLKVALFRPLSSALMWLDRAMFGDDPLLCHVHSALWWLGMSVLWGALLSHFLPWRGALFVHTLCVLHPANGMLLGWIANRNASVAMLFGLCALWLQVRRRERSTEASSAPSGSRALPWLIPVCAALALLAGEYGLCILVFGLAYEACGPEPWRVRAARLLPICAVLVVYALLRSGLHFGTRASGMYIDPTAEPVAFVRAGAARGPVLVADLVLGLRSNWWSAGYPWADVLMRALHLSSAWVMDLRPMRTLHVELGALACVIAVFVGRYAVQQNPALRFAAWALPLSLLLTLGGAPESRLLLPALFGWSLLVTQALISLLAPARSRRPAHTPRAPGMLALLGVASLVALEARATVTYSAEDRAFLPRLAHAVRASILAPGLDRALEHVQDAFLLSAVDPTTTIYIPMLRRWHGHRGPARCHLLLSTLSPIRLDRLSAHEFRLTREQSHYAPPDVYAEAFSRAPPQPGQLFFSRGLRATVEEVKNGMPIVVRFAADKNLDDPSIVLLAQTTSGLVPMRFPEPGTSMRIAPANFPFGLIDSQGAFDD